MKKSPFAEYMAMTLDDLQREVKSQRTNVAKMRLGVEMKKEKNTGSLRRERRQLARLLTALSHKEKAPKAPSAKAALQAKARSPKVSASASSRAKRAPSKL